MKLTDVPNQEPQLVWDSLSGELRKQLLHKLIGLGLKSDSNEIEKLNELLGSMAFFVTIPVVFWLQRFYNQSFSQAIDISAVPNGNFAFISTDYNDHVLWTYPPEQDVDLGLYGKYVFISYADRNDLFFITKDDRNWQKLQSFSKKLKYIFLSQSGRYAQARYEDHHIEIFSIPKDGGRWQEMQSFSGLSDSSYFSPHGTDIAILYPDHIRVFSQSEKDEKWKEIHSFPTAESIRFDQNGVYVCIMYSDRIDVFFTPPGGGKWEKLEVFLDADNVYFEQIDPENLYAIVKYQSQIDVFFVPKDGKKWKKLDSFLGEFNIIRFSACGSFVQVIYDFRKYRMSRVDIFSVPRGGQKWEKIQSFSQVAFIRFDPNEKYVAVSYIDLDLSYVYSLSKDGNEWDVVESFPYVTDITFYQNGNFASVEHSDCFDVFSVPFDKGKWKKLQSFANATGVQFCSNNQYALISYPDKVDVFFIPESGTGWKKLQSFLKIKVLDIHFNAHNTHAIVHYKDHTDVFFIAQDGWIFLESFCHEPGIDYSYYDFYKNYNYTKHELFFYFQDNTLWIQDLTYKKIVSTLIACNYSQLRLIVDIYNNRTNEKLRIDSRQKEVLKNMPKELQDVLNKFVKN